MMRFLIIDDDVFVHTNLKKMINWEAEGFSLYDAAIYGAEAVRMIDQIGPDIVITDMNMPGIDGVGIIRYLLEKHTPIKVIALSAYDDFEYVKQSLKLGAVDYILKHTLTPEVLLTLLHGVRETIFREKRKGEEEQRLDEQIQTGRSFLQQNFIKTLIRDGTRDHAMTVRRIHDLGLRLSSKNLVVVAGEIDDYSALPEKFSVSEIENLMKSFINMGTEILKDTVPSLITILEEGKFVMIFSFEAIRSNQEIYHQVFTTLTRIKTTIKRYLNLTACFGLDGICPDLTELDRYYQKARRQLDKKFYAGKDMIFHDPLTVEMKNDLHILEIKDEKRIFDMIQSGKSEELRLYLDKIFERIKQDRPSPNSTKIAFVTLINIANKVARDTVIDLALIYGDGCNPYEHMERLETAEEVKAWLVQVYEKAINLLELFHLNPDYDELIKKTIGYIHKNYKTGISLCDIAESIGVNSSYLSRKFKQDCGKGIAEYLNDIRIEQAKLLMKNGLKKVKEIACEVGFNNYNYFFKVFKECEGMTPLEYEKSCRG